MAYITLFEMATQNGEIVSHMGKYLKKHQHTYDIQYNRDAGVREYTVYLDSDLKTPLMRYPIPDRDISETPGMWARKVRDELDKAWAVSLEVRKPKPAPPPLRVSEEPAPEIPEKAFNVSAAGPAKPAKKPPPRKIKV